MQRMQAQKNKTTTKKIAPALAALRLNFWRCFKSGAD
jgi:hypothetical protein